MTPYDVFPGLDPTNNQFPDSVMKAIAESGRVGEVIATALTDKSDVTHNHDGRYYIKVPSLTPLLNDTFSRTGALAGSTSDSGQTWQSTHTAWQTNGQSASANSFAIASIALPDRVYRARFDLDIITQGSVSRSLSLVLGGLNDLWVTVSINPSGGCQVAMQKRFSEASSVLIVPAFPVLTPNSGVAQSLIVSVTILDGKITLEAGGSVRTVEITKAEEEAIDPAIGLTANNDITGISLSQVQVHGGGRPEDALAPLNHSHAIRDVNGLEEALSNIDLDVTINDIPGLRAELDAAGDGHSAYEVAVRNGYTGTVDQWLASLKGQSGSNVLPDREAVTGALGIYSANSYGASSAATAELNRDAFQAACDAAALSGGGRVVATAGTYYVSGIIQDSRVELYLPGVTLKHPTGVGSTPIVSARQRETTGSIEKGSRTLTVTSTAGIELGGMVAIRAAGGLLDTQYTTLKAGITSTMTTGVMLTNSEGFLSAGWLTIGDEVIGYTGINPDGELTGVVRGALGSTRASHNAGWTIGLARRLYGEVVGISGYEITLDTPSMQTVSGSVVTVGANALKISGASFDGNLPRPSTSFGPYPVSWGLVSHGKITDHRVVNAESALMLTRGSRYTRVRGVHAHDCGAPESSRGASLWMYEGCDRNLFEDLTITGSVWVGVYLDDRTSTADEWAAPNRDNTVENFVVAPIRPTGYPAAIDITGSVRNRVRSGSIIDTSVGVKIDNGAGQVHTHDNKVPDTGGNQISDISMTKVDNPWSVKTNGNILHDITYESSGANGNNDSDSLVYAVTRVSDGTPTLA